MRKEPLESAIQKQILDLLALKGYLAVKFSSVGIWNKKTEAYIPQRQKGVADLLVCGPGGKFIAIEVKRPGGKVSPDQQAFLDKVTKQGGCAFVAYGVEDVLKNLPQQE